MSYLLQIIKCRIVLRMSFCIREYTVTNINIPLNSSRWTFLFDVRHNASLSHQSVLFLNLSDWDFWSTFFEDALDEKKNTERKICPLLRHLLHNREKQGQHAKFQAFQQLKKNLKNSQSELFLSATYLRYVGTRQGYTKAIDNLLLEIEDVEDGSCLHGTKNRRTLGWDTDEELFRLLGWGLDKVRQKWRRGWVYYRKEDCDSEHIESERVSGLGHE